MRDFTTYCALFTGKALDGSETSRIATVAFHKDWVYHEMGKGHKSVTDSEYCSLVRRVVSAYADEPKFLESGFDKVPVAGTVRFVAAWRDDNTQPLSSKGG